ncbi:MAG TPA: ABC transporter ATP-binding protein [Solirubrobacteraceae bacterium]|nr:ABC transporter ATP-binding protein [Solirubrobacteraceae bacterium]
MNRAILPGEVVLEDAWRSFPARNDRAATLKELFTSFRSRRHPDVPDTHALAGVSLHINRGETVGIIGRNGAGKTSTLRVLAGIIPLHHGRAECGGRVATLIELGAGFGREFTGRENIRVNAALHGMGREEIDARIDEMIEFSELGHFIDSPIKTYSSGMLVRLGFAVAAHIDADVLLIDEVLAVGDEAFQRKCLRRIAERIEEGATLVLVSHSPATIERACRRVVVLDGGQVTYDGPTAQGLRFYHRQLGLEEAEPAMAGLPSGAPLAIAQARLEDGEGQPRQIFAPGERLRAALLLDPVPAAAEEREVELVIEVRQFPDRPVFRTAQTTPTGAGRRQVSFEIPRLNLLGGDYDLAVGVREGGEDAPVVFDRVLAFSVVAAEGAEGVVDLRGTWELEPTPVEVRP